MAKPVNYMVFQQQLMLRLSVAYEKNEHFRLKVRE